MPRTQPTTPMVGLASASFAAAFTVAWAADAAFAGGGMRESSSGFTGEGVGVGSVAPVGAAAARKQCGMNRAQSGTGVCGIYFLTKSASAAGAALFFFFFAMMSAGG